MMNVDTNKKFTASYSVHASPKKLKEKLGEYLIVCQNGEEIIASLKQEQENLINETLIYH